MASTENNFRKAAREAFLDYVNDYITTDSFAMAYGMTQAQAVVVIEIGRRYHEEALASEHAMREAHRQLGNR